MRYGSAESDLRRRRAKVPETFVMRVDASDASPAGIDRRCSRPRLSAPSRRSPPSAGESAQRTHGLFAAASKGDAAADRPLRCRPARRVDARDAYERARRCTWPGLRGAHARAMRALVRAGADPNALERDRYDIVTIAAVANDVPTLRGGPRPRGTRGQRHEPLRRHRAHRGRAPGARRGGAPLDCSGRAAGPRQQPALDRGDRVDRARRRRQAPRPRRCARSSTPAPSVNRADRSGTTPLALARSARLYAMTALLVAERRAK